MNTNLKSTVTNNMQLSVAKRKPPSMRVGALAIAIAGAMAISSNIASAAETTFSGYTDGCFGAPSCAPPTTPTTATQTLTFLGLTYKNSTFNVTTAAGFAAIGGSPGTPNVDNLGSFTLSGTPATYNGQHFNLGVVFTGPTGVLPVSTVFTDVILGTVFATDNGGVFINFDNTPQHFVFGSGATAGYFDFFINDVSVVAGRSVGVTGTIISVLTPVPEPDTYALMFAGLGLMGFAARRRKQPTA